jgi:hypothetical protein
MMQKKPLTKHPFMIKAMKKLGIGGTYINRIKGIYDKPTANIALNGRKTDIVSSTVRNKARYPLSPFLFNTVLEFQARAIRQDKEIKEIQKEKEEVKLFLFADDMILNLKDLEDTTKKISRYDKHFQQSRRI